MAIENDNVLTTFDLLAQLVEHNTFNVGVLGSSPKQVTQKTIKQSNLYKCM
jgi:hypothetical protein